MTLRQVIILLFFSLSVSSCFSLADESSSNSINQHYCKIGQVAWCQNFSTAIECNSVKHCLQSVWLTQKPLSSVGCCSSCESEIENIRKGIGSNTTKEVIKELLENVCDLTFITELFRKRCEKYIDNYVDSYFNELLDLLKSDIDAATICHILGFCINDELNQLSVRYQNVILHLPAANIIDVSESQKLLGSVKCMWGPSYWCNNLSSSVECKSTSHCIHSMWQKLKYHGDDDSICEICEDMVLQARNQLQRNETQKEIKQVFEGSCKLIHIEEIQKECFKLTDQFVPELTEMVVSQMNPVAICTVVGLCNNIYIDKLIVTRVSPTLCTNCSVALTAVQQYLQHAPYNIIYAKFHELCDQFSSFSELCSSLVESNFIAIYNFLLKEMYPFPVCRNFGLCADQYDMHSLKYDVISTEEIKTMLATGNKDLPCDLCEQLMKHFQEILTANTTEDEFLEVLQSICKQSGKFKANCLAIVNQNFEKIYKFLTQELNPLEMCREANVCSKSNMVTDEKMNLISNRPSPIVILADINTTVSYLPSPEKPVRNVECKICKMIVQILLKEMNKPEYEHNFEKLFSKVCSLVPSNKLKCEKFILSYDDALIKVLPDQTDPDVACSMLDSCLSNEALDYNNALCPICQYVMHFIQEELEKPEEQQKVEDVVRRICKFVPKSEVTECESFISDYAALIISILSQEMDPNLVCPALKVCPNFNSQEESCFQCQYLMDNLISNLNYDHSESSILNVLQTIIPKTGNLTLTALQLKTFHSDDIIDMVIADFNAQESCLFVHFCDADMLTSANIIASENDLLESNDISSTSLTQSPKLVASKPSCELCELLIQIYEDKLTSNDTEEEIESELQKFCNKITNIEFHSNCSHFVNKYVPKIVEFLKQDVQPVDVCSMVKLCPLSLTDVNNEDVHSCELCEAVVGSFEGLASDPLMSRQSIVELIQLCEIFDEKDQSICMKVISYVAPQLESLALEIPSWYYCSKIHMCSHGANLTYKKVCNNRTKWCVNTHTAVLCDKLKYCQQNMWKSSKPSPINNVN